MDRNELLSSLSKDPDYLDSLDKDGLLEAVDVLTSYVTEKASAIKAGTSDDAAADLAAAKEARERLDRVQVRLTEIAEAEAKVAAEADALTEGLTPVAETESTETEEPSEEASVEVEETPVVEVEEKEPALVAAKPSLGKMNARKPKDMNPPPVEKPNALVASVGAAVPGVKKIESGLDVANALIAQHKKLGSFRPDGLVSYPIASFDYDHGYSAERDQEKDFTLVGRMKEDAELLARKHINDVLGRPSNALVAAIPEPCGPFEPVFTYFSVSSRDGLLGLPTANARRGGIIYPDLVNQVTIGAEADLVTAIGTVWDEAQPKPFFLVECGTEHECVVQPYPTRLRFRNWDARFNPEYVAQTMSEAMIFQAHKMNATHIAAIKTLATNTALTGFGGGSIVSAVNTLSFAAARLRETHKASRNAAVSVLAPLWVLDALATDLITREATLSFENARARAAAAFASFDLDMQWLYDTPESIVAANAYPSTADFTMFFPGSYVRLDGGGLNFAETRDSTLNGLNQFEFFMETSEVICEVGIKGWDILDVPICPSGVTGTGVADLCEAVS